MAPPRDFDEDRSDSVGRGCARLSLAFLTFREEWIQRELVGGDKNCQKFVRRVAFRSKFPHVTRQHYVLTVSGWNVKRTAAIFTY